MNDSDAKIRKGLGPRREATSYQTLADIVIPAGTILRQAAAERGGQGYVEAPIGLGKDFTANFVVQIHADADASGFVKRVVAA